MSLESEDRDFSPVLPSSNMDSILNKRDQVMELSPDSRDQDIYGHTPKTTLGANGLLMIPMISDNIRAIENGFILSFAVNGEHYLVD